MNTIARNLVRSLGCVLLAVAIHSSFILAFTNFANEDTFYNLTSVGRFCLVVLSFSLVAILFSLNQRKSRLIQRLFIGDSRWQTWLLDVFLTIALFSIALYFSRQVYYGLYQLLLDNLAFQWVFPPLFELFQGFQYLVFMDRESYSGLLKGITLWAMLFLTSSNYFSMADVFRKFRR